ncbi:DNA-processing protein DprA [uncultured Sunxiuqinia sp.]|uniref:DNA-processing protein DprA n=1 Tax=uncultured Sunxiuqinia sp. TaxID=1573825 RepID=UPI00262EC8CA|nr:DNA-processing protein DprA [uncultured Sunxiuqinia sp.]
MSPFEQLKYQIALSLIPGIGCANAKRLMASLGGIPEIFKASKKQLLKVPNIGELKALKILESDVLGRAEAEISFIEKNHIQHAFYWDDHYPVRLKRCVDAPLMLYWRGNVNFNAEKIVAMVGTRNATSYGRAFCEELVEAMAQRGGYTVVSGLAYGIDVAAHKACLKYEVPTLGVLAHGLERVYPSLHRSVADRMLSDGGLVTDFISEVEIERTNFLRRNRIIAGLADATIIVESAEKGGSLVTADIADSYNRDVFALPGRSTDSYSKGCNQLIKSNKALMIENLDDLEYAMGWQQAIDRPSKIQKQLFVELTAEEQQLVDVLDVQEVYIDQLCSKVKMPMGKVSSILLALEFKGLVISLPGKMYKLS